jgi:hypothetical protein
MPAWMIESRRRLAQSRPLPRRPTLLTEPAPILQTLTPALVEEGFAAVARGEGIPLPLAEGQLPVRLAPAVREPIEQSGLPIEKVLRISTDLADQLGHPETAARLHRWPLLPETLLHQIAIHGRGFYHVFRFALGQREGSVVVAACEHDRLRE